MTLAIFFFFCAFSHRDDLCIEFWREGRSIRLPAEQPMKGLHGARSHQLQPENTAVLKTTLGCSRMPLFIYTDTTMDVSVLSPRG